MIISVDLTRLIVLTMSLITLKDVLTVIGVLGHIIIKMQLQKKKLVIVKIFYGYGFSFRF